MRIFFAGDFCSKPSTNRISVSEGLRNIINSCDFKIVNFEVPLKPSAGMFPKRKRERYYQNDDSPAFLKGLGFDLFQISNNHIFDWGEDGFRKTRKALGNGAFGAGEYEEALRVKVVEKDGIKIGFLALSFAAYSGVFDDVSNHEGLGCAYIHDYKVNHVIIESKKIVDYLFVLPHDGIEYIDVPLPETIAKYRDFIDMGADGVFGTHPHCPQGWEDYKGKPIFYSLGNFFFNSKDNYDYRATCPHWYEGLCVVLTIDNGGLKWEEVNTKNVNNICLELDSSDERATHNKTICNYLVDKESYWVYFDKICSDTGYGKLLSIVDATVHHHHLKQSARALARQISGLFKKNKSVDDSSLIRLLSNDANKQLLTWALKRHRVTHK